MEKMVNLASLDLLALLDSEDHLVQVSVLEDFRRISSLRF